MKRRKRKLKTKKYMRKMRKLNRREREGVRGERERKRESMNETRYLPESELHILNNNKKSNIHNNILLAPSPINST